MYLDNEMTQELLQENVFTNTAITSYQLEGLIASQVQSVYKYNGLAYEILTPVTQYTLSGSTLTLLGTGVLATGEHVVVMPINNLQLTFTGTEASVRVQNKKIIFHKDDTNVYDALNLYSQNLEIPQELIVDISETKLDGFYYFTVDASYNCYGSLGLVTGIGINIDTDLTTYNVEGCAVIINNQYVGDVLAYDGIMIVIPSTAVITVNNVSDILQIITTGDLKFALGGVSDVVPVDENFKRMLSIPTLTTAAPTQYVWLKESVIIPTTTVESPNMPFKLIGQIYPE
jgi:hypothetical protein